MTRQQAPGKESPAGVPEAQALQLASRTGGHRSVHKGAGRDSGSWPGCPHAGKEGTPRIRADTQTCCWIRGPRTPPGRGHDGCGRRPRQRERGGPAGLVPRALCLRRARTGRRRGVGGKTATALPPAPRAPQSRAACAPRPARPHSPGWRGPGWRALGTTRGRRRGGRSAGRGGREAGRGRSGPGGGPAANRCPALRASGWGAAARVARPPPGTRGPAPSARPRVRPRRRRRDPARHGRGRGGRD